ncbi:uncharacterized protein BDZ83DRAFT_98073 [Colletotrichum acutatum]|uniref:Uncharacterized protein n=1 Tax=Glomerella acutata TaxID=27357 RepID=A0AAD8XHY6_GLOAC|nr:uncharacterized protein BDZ83DRAFT_98073 [Colletotrichum acutatum]KAK1728699.1 hypothetical protein BDZ83DRAFT_98073 [Colletotrichum acutatum]
MQITDNNSGEALMIMWMSVNSSTRIGGTPSTVAIIKGIKTAYTSVPGIATGWLVLTMAVLELAQHHVGWLLAVLLWPQLGSLLYLHYRDNFQLHWWTKGDAPRQVGASLRKKHEQERAGHHRQLNTHLVVVLPNWQDLELWTPSLAC